MDKPPYVCWEAHHEDLTDKVNRELVDPGRLTLYYRRKDRAAAGGRAKVFATCSEGHLNTFDVALPAGSS